MRTSNGIHVIRPRRAWVGAAVVAISVAAACGSTVQRDVGSAAPSLDTSDAEELTSDDDQPGNQGEPTNESQSTRVAGTAPRPASPGSGSPAPTDPVPTGPTDTGGETAAGPPSPDGPSAAGQGITDDEILIGIDWQDPAAAAGVADALGGGGGAQGREGGKNVPQAIVDYINDNGGIAGRRIVPIYHETNLAEVFTKEGRAREAQRMCARWTEDAHVFAFVMFFGWSDEIVNCAVNARTPYVTGRQQYVDEQWAAQIAPFLYVPTGFTVERRERAMVERLAAQGFFNGDAKVGLMIDGTSPSYKKGADRALKPALEELGVEVVHEVVYPDLFDSPWPNYVLQFQSAGATHVIWGAGLGSFPPLLFMRAAENQMYRPRYGIASDRDPQVLARDAPVEQVRRVTAFGWRPVSDLATDPGPITTRDAECRELLQDAGQIQRSSTTHGYCDTLFFLRDALNSAPALTPEGMATAVDVFGTSWESAISWSTRFSPGHYDGVGTVRNLTYAVDCGCFEYSSDDVEAP